LHKQVQYIVSFIHEFIYIQLDKVYILQRYEPSMQLDYYSKTTWCWYRL